MIVAIFLIVLFGGGAGRLVYIAAKEAGGLVPLLKHLAVLAVGLVLFIMVLFPAIWIAVGMSWLQDWLRE